MTEGEKMVRIDFNVSNSGDVANIKTKIAELINYINQMEIPAEDAGEVARAKALAKTKLQEASWAAVFAATSKIKQ